MAPIRETFGGRARRRLTHLTRHPLAWGRYVWVREVRRREVPFRVNPRFLDWGPTYRVSRRALARVALRPPAELDGYFHELAPLHAALLNEVGALPSAGALMQAPLLYVLVRARRPSRIIETGISSGFSARLILEALRRNGGGRLHSIGVDVLALSEPKRPEASGLAGRSVGWLVPEALRPWWTLHLGTSQDLLPPLLDHDPSPVDVFLHDSLHQYATMRFEYETAWPRLRPGGFLLSHDIHTSAAWFEFLGHRPEVDSDELDHDLGIARVPGPDPA